MLPFCKAVCRNLPTRRLFPKLFVLKYVQSVNLVLFFSGVARCIPQLEAPSCHMVFGSKKVLIPMMGRSPEAFSFHNRPLFLNLSALVLCFMAPRTPPRSSMRSNSFRRLLQPSPSFFNDVGALQGIFVLQQPKLPVDDLLNRHRPSDGLLCWCCDRFIMAFVCRSCSCHTTPAALARLFGCRMEFYGRAMNDRRFECGTRFASVHLRCKIAH